MRKSYIVLNGKRNNCINIHTRLYFDIFLIKTPIQFYQFEKCQASKRVLFQNCGLNMSMYLSFLFQMDLN